MPQVHFPFSHLQEEPQPQAVPHPSDCETDSSVAPHLQLPLRCSIVSGHPFSLSATILFKSPMIISSSPLKYIKLRTGYILLLSLKNSSQEKGPDPFLSPLTKLILRLQISNQVGRLF